MRKIILSAVLVFLAVVFVGAASADTITFSLSGPGWNSAGTFSASPTAPGTWLVTGPAGTFNGVGITGVCPLGTCGFAFAYNNNYYWPAPVLDIYGIVVTLSNGDLVNFCYDTGCGGAANVYTAISWNPSVGYGYFNADTVALGQPVPEPGTLAFICTGALGLAGTLRRRLF